MYKPFINRIKNNVNFCLVILMLTPCAYAKKIDMDQEIKISASRQAADLKNKIFSYIDNVVISQGTLVINADLVQVITDKNNDANVYIAKGKPATFHQTLDNGTPINLKANEIRYEPAKGIIVISGDAVLEQEGSKVSGKRITYNFETEFVSAESDEDGNVRTILQPKTTKKLKGKLK